MGELKRCPFCGQLPTTRFMVSGMNMEYGDAIDFEVVCRKCGTCKTVRLTVKKDSAYFTEIDKAMEKVKAAWNMRWDNNEEVV